MLACIAQPGAALVKRLETITKIIKLHSARMDEVNVDVAQKASFALETQLEVAYDSIPGGLKELRRVAARLGTLGGPSASEEALRKQLAAATSRAESATSRAESLERELAARAASAPSTSGNGVPASVPPRFSSPPPPPPFPCPL